MPNLFKMPELVTLKHFKDWPLCYRVCYMSLGDPSELQECGKIYKQLFYIHKHSNYNHVTVVRWPMQSSFLIIHDCSSFRQCTTTSGDCPVCLIVSSQGMALVKVSLKINEESGLGSIIERHLRHFKIKTGLEYRSEFDRQRL